MPILSFTSSFDMRRFLLGFTTYCLLVGLLLGGMLVARTWMWQGRVGHALCIRPSTRLLCVGNSHTGCTWLDSEELGIQVIWLDSGPLPFARMRLAEIDKRRGFGNVRSVVVDCDMTSIKVTRTCVYRCVEKQWPLAWRYLDWLPVSKVEVCERIFLPLGREWSISGLAGQSNRKWSDLSAAEKRKDISHYLEDEEKIEGMDVLVLAHLRAIDEICKKNGLNFYVMMAPLTPEKFALYVNEQAVWTERLRHLGYQVLDYTHECPDRDFQDSHHLNYDGRVRFTKKHKDELIRGEKYGR